MSATVPAWKRLGLKLKQPDSSPASASASPARPASVGHQHPTPKRKLDYAPPGPADDSPKRARREDPRNAGAGSVRHIKSKSVSFGDTPTKADLVNSSSPSHQPSTSTPTTSSLSKAKSPLNTKQTAKEAAKKAKGPAKKQKPPPPLDLTAAVEYLRQWKNSRDTWKFNKNHQSALIKHVFDDEGIPTSDINTFYEYIRDLKGFIRTRLRESAMEVRAHDQNIGAKGFPTGTKDVAAKQSTYETMLADFFGPPPGYNKRKAFDEADYKSTSEDADVIIRRVIKRMRAELILDDLSDSGETDASTTSTTNTSSGASSETITGSEAHVDSSEAFGDDKKLSIGSGVAGKRRRKLRTNVDDSSSDESESDSDSDSSSDDSSSDGSDDEDDEPKKADGYESSDSSSSSSSSSSGEDSGSDADSDEEEL
ncbi:hypothetical protein CC79DRAFT_1369533 [Sarocladium strictum]